MIEWLNGQSTAATCPVCGAGGVHAGVLAAPSLVEPTKRLTLLACNRCGTGFYDDRRPPEYEREDFAQYSVKFYVEKGAGIDAMLKPVAPVSFSPDTRYLEIGCGFGFSLDFVARQYGAKVLGIDPSAMAAAGRKRLALDIVNGYFDRNMIPSVGPRDVVYCSELIEHIEDPGDLLDDLGAVLAPGGLLVLTTPAMESVTAGLPAGTLLPTLSPGVHLILYTVGSLEMLLRRHGYTDVHVTHDTHTLIAYASRGGTTLPEVSTGMPADALIDYFRGRYEAAGDDTLLRNGFLFRLMKHLVIANRCAEADGLRGAVDGFFRQAYGLDLTDPAAIALPEIIPGMELGAAMDRQPLNLPNHLHYRGLVALLHHHDSPQAIAHFAAAVRLAAPLRDMLHRGLMADAELDSTVGACLNLIAFALRTLPAGPARAQLPFVAETIAGIVAGGSAAAALGAEASGDLAAMAGLALDLAWDATAAAGDHALAESTLAIGETWAALAGGPSPELAVKALQVRGLLALLHHHDGRQAIAHFTAALQVMAAPETAAGCFELVLFALRTVPAAEARNLLPMVATALAETTTVLPARERDHIALLADLALDLALDATAGAGDHTQGAATLALAEAWVALVGRRTADFADKAVQVRRSLAIHDPASQLQWLDGSSDADVKAAVASPAFVARVAAGDWAMASRYEPSLAGHPCVQALEGKSARATLDVEAVSFCNALAIYRNLHQRRYADAHRIYDMVLGAVAAHPEAADGRFDDMVAMLKQGKADTPPAGSAARA